jgi:hypothetical protein
MRCIWQQVFHAVEDGFHIAPRQSPTRTKLVCYVAAPSARRSRHATPLKVSPMLIARHAPARGLACQVAQPVFIFWRISIPNRVAAGRLADSR